MSARVRLRIVLPAIAVGIVVILAACEGFLRLRPHGFAAEWDRNVAATAPLVFPIARADPALHRLMLEKTEAAYHQDGWSAATQVFYKIVDNRINIYAGDAAILACHAAWRDVYRALLPTPHLCAQMFASGAAGVKAGAAAAAIAREEHACNEMTLDGGRRRLAIDPPEHMAEAESVATAARAMDAPHPLPAPERATLTSAHTPDDGAMCRARLHLDENIAALPAAQAARYYRSEYDTDKGDFVYSGKETPLAPGGPPPDFHCAPAGTRFTLSMEASATGLPIVWEALGQDGWDCRMRSSVSGERAVFAPDDYARANALRMLWPLAAGKTAHCHCEYDRLTDFRLTGPRHLWLPIGTTEAWGIEETVRTANGTVLYTTTRYWAPALGFMVGQHTVVTRGDWPDSAPPDWQVVAVDAPRVTG